MCVDTAGSIPRAAFYSGSSIGRATVSKTVGCRFKACPERHAMYSRGTAVQSIAGHLAAKVPDAAAPARFTPVRQTECMGAAYFLISFTFPVECEEEIKGYISENTKEPLEKAILNCIRGVMEDEDA